GLISYLGFKNRDITSISLAIYTFNILRSTLRYCLSDSHRLAPLALYSIRNSESSPLKVWNYPSYFSQRKIVSSSLLLILEAKIILKSRIDPNNIYNFNKTSFIIGLIIISALNGSSGSTYTPTAKKRFAGFTTIYIGPTKNYPSDFGQ
ncbi:uncharacterized protein N7500_006537, partial [Penicillium coprophilum]|uniref:uncharacterized protein n=1 Tax=Penicillium coprophilum TaxID=36646 RepID=UPI002388B2E5